ncbi:hypothetical protein AJ78_01321 [Emergomyces pasteurianus Ep9510]|uniref:Potassium channel tetramerisation-type BTB domain-containing protein n=1 Tax=Emergomyces pasteurianus Ep9510 TaxID=1447872 RepID=A0A1J9PS14_9EURO|nr:hypothetical protein AJ78_01321 [Emergomyces pasteurianus Ep9510]
MQLSRLNSVPTGPIKIQVGNDYYSTRIDTLVGRSNFFNSFFSGPWLSQKQKDGSIYFEGAPSLFRHIIQYLRHGVFPLDFSADGGHNYGFYAGLLQEAKHFECPGLITFLEDQCYLKCVTWEITHETYNCEMEQSRYYDSNVVDFQLIRTKDSEAENYVCPRGIVCHHDKPDSCGRRCLNARAKVDATYYKVSTPQYLAVKKKLKFNFGWMSEDGKDFIGHIQRKQAANHAGDRHPTLEGEQYSGDPCENPTTWDVVELSHDDTLGEQVIRTRPEQMETVSDS